MLKNATISPYKFASNLESYDPNKDRELLMKKREVQKLESELQEKGASLIPLEVKAGKFIKVTLGLGKGLKKVDKRHKLKEKDVKKKLRKGEDY